MVRQSRGHNWERPARVQPSYEQDNALNPPGKQCAPLGMPHRPGHLSRSHSSSAILTCPGGWLDETQRREVSLSSGHKERMRSTMTNWDSMARSDFAGTIAPRPSTVHISAPGALSASGGGLTQGARQVRPVTSAFTATGDRPASSSRYNGGAGFRYCDSAKAYNHEKHGWHDPRGQAEAERLARPSEVGSWAWTMRKARDHVGYGDDGVVNWGDIQSSAVSGDVPDWFIGPRTQPGPMNTKYVPVRRCPVVKIQGKEMTIRAKSYEQGPCLDTLETLHPGPQPATPARKERAKSLATMMEREHEAKRCNFHSGGGMQVRERPFPTSGHRTYESYDHGLSRRF